MARSVIPWSHSSLDSYETCPKAFYETKIAKSVPFVETEAIIWGNEVHKAFENYFVEGDPFPARMAKWQPLATKVLLAPGDMFAEHELAVTADYKPTGYWDDNAWQRGKDDVLKINGKKALSIDWKTGKEKKGSDQLELSSLRVFANFPEVEEVATAYSWLATGNWTRAKFHRSQFDRLWDKYQERVAKLLWSEKHNAWPAKPSGLCKRSKKPGSTYAGCPVTNCPFSEHYAREK